MRIFFFLKQKGISSEPSSNGGSALPLDLRIDGKKGRSSSPSPSSGQGMARGGSVSPDEEEDDGDGRSSPAPCPPLLSINKNKSPAPSSCNSSAGSPPPSMGALFPGSIHPAMLEAMYRESTAAASGKMPRLTTVFPGGPYPPHLGNHQVQQQQPRPCPPLMHPITGVLHHQVKTKLHHFLSFLVNVVHFLCYVI